MFINKAGIIKKGLVLFLVAIFSLSGLLLFSERVKAASCSQTLGSGQVDMNVDLYWGGVPRTSYAALSNGEPFKGSFWSVSPDGGTVDVPVGTVVELVYTTSGPDVVTYNEYGDSVYYSGGMTGKAEWQGGEDSFSWLQDGSKQGTASITVNDDTYFYFNSETTCVESTDFTQGGLVNNGSVVDSVVNAGVAITLHAITEGQANTGTVTVNSNLATSWIITPGENGTGSIGASGGYPTPWEDFSMKLPGTYTISNVPDISCKIKTITSTGGSSSGGSSIVLADVEGQRTGVFNINYMNDPACNPPPAPPAGSPPNVNLRFNDSDGPITVSSGTLGTLSWNSSGADSCTASGGWSGGKSTYGTQNITITSSQFYIITCYNQYGSGSDTVEVDMGNQAPPPPPPPSSENWGCSTSANPNDGALPLNNVDVTVTSSVGGWAHWNSIDCTNDGTYEITNDTDTSENGVKAYNNLCDYPSTGNYIINVRNQQLGGAGSVATCTTNVSVCTANYGQSCTGTTSSPNACGQTNPGGAGTIQCNGSCGGTTGTTPSNPVNYGQACTGATSSPNACGQTSLGGTGTIQCNGSCSGTTGSTPAVTIPGGNTYGASCQSSANACGQTQSNGTWQCSGSCSSTIHANPTYYGQACTGATSSPNACGQTSPGSAGTYQCAGNNSQANCSGATGVVPPNTCISTANITATPTTVIYGGTSTIAWSCTNSSSGSVSGIGSGLSGSGSTGALTSNRTYTVTCLGLNGSSVSKSVAVAVSAPTVGITANGINGPIIVPWSSDVTIAWSSTNAGSCTITPPGWSGLSGSRQTGNLITPGTYVYTVTCSGNGSASANQFVTVSNPVPLVYSTTYSSPDYCSSGPGGFVTWSYSDPSGSPQTSYEVQITDTGNFNNPFYSSGQINSSSKVFAIPNGVLQFNLGYKARVRAWNSYNGVSSWSSPTNTWNTPAYAYPNVIPPYQFTWPTPPKPQQNKPVQFTDHAVFGGGNINNRQWNWNFGDGITSTLQNPPAHTYTEVGTYTVTETVTDAANQTCSYSQSVNIQKPIPVIKEVAPR